MIYDGVDIGMVVLVNYRCDVVIKFCSDGWF